MKKIYFRKEFICGLSIYFQQIQLSLLIIPTNEIKDFVIFFKERLMPQKVLEIIHLRNSSEKIVIPKEYKRWIESHNKLNNQEIQEILSSLPKISIIKRIECLVKSYFGQEMYFFSKQELDSLIFLLQEFKTVLDYQDEKRIRYLQSIRPLFVHAQKQILLPRLTFKEQNEVTLYVEHFAINPIHPIISLEDSVGYEWLSLN